MAWGGRADRSRAEPKGRTGGTDAPAERASPGLAALFDSLDGGRTHSVLDLGPARGGHLHVLGGVARFVRFGALVPRTCTGEAWVAALRAVPPQPEAPYDVVLAWDLLDRLASDERSLAVEHLAAITAPEARLHAIVEADGRGPAAPRTFTLLDHGRIREEPIGPPVPVAQPLLPAQVERSLAPFVVVRAFVVAAGAREYLAMKGVGPWGSPSPPQSR